MGLGHDAMTQGFSLRRDIRMGRHGPAMTQCIWLSVVRGPWSVVKDKGCDGRDGAIRAG